MQNIPSWVTNALNALGPLATNASRQTKLGYGGLVQGIANTLGYPIPSAQQDQQFPYGRSGDVAVHHDLGGEQARPQLTTDLDAMASYYANQVPVGDVWSDVAPLQNTQWNGANNPAVGNAGWKGGHRRSPIAPGLPPFASTYMARPQPHPGIPEQGYWIEHAGGTNAEGENTAGWNEWRSTAPAVPAVDDPATHSLPLDPKNQENVKVQLYRTILEQMGGIDLNKFDKDLGTYMQQDPSIYNDLKFIEQQPYYSNYPDDSKLKLMWAILAAKRGQALKNSPVSAHYEGVLK